MALEPITRQEQIIAGKDLEPITRMERFLKEYGGGSGSSVQSDWNQTDETAADFIRNKPFGDMPTGGDTLYWDGNTEGLEHVDVYGDGSFLFVKLCNTVVTKEDVANGYSFEIHVGETFEGTLDGETAQSLFQDNGFGMLYEVAAVIPCDGFDWNGVTFAKGIYSMVDDVNTYSFSITIPGYTGFPVTKKMEEKYLPGAVLLYTDETYMYKTADVSDASNRITKAELMNAVLQGNPIFITDEGNTMFFAPLQYGLEGDFMVAFLWLGTGTGTLYTAEYTPETTT